MKTFSLFFMRCTLTVLLLLLSACWLLACSAKKSPEQQNELADHIAISQRAAQLTPEENKAVVKEVGKNFLYGDGLGTAIVNVGTTVVFPPYGLFLLGNLALSAGGYEPLGVSTVLPEEGKQAWTKAYSSVMSNPGRLAAAVAGEEYRSNEIARKKIEKYVSLSNTDPINDDY